MTDRDMVIQLSSNTDTDGCGTNNEELPFLPVAGSSKLDCTTVMHHFVFLGAIETHKLDKDKIRFEVRIQETWRVDGVAGRLLPKKASANLPPFPIWAKTQESVLTNNRGQKIRCLCPDFKPGEVYLFLTQSYQVPNDNRMELMLDTQSIVLPWRESWRRRLNRFVRRAAKGRCRGVTQDNGPRANGARIERVQRLRTVPGYYAANFESDQIVSDGPLRRTSMRRAPVPNDNRMELMLDTQSIVLPWRESWRRRLNRFVRRAAKGRCRGVTQDNGPRANGARIERVQRLRTVPGYYAANFESDQIVSDGPLRRTSMRRAPVSRPSGSQPFLRLTSDQATNQGHRSQSNQPQFTYYNP
ncbi:uncharacterized protein DEA37_0008995 [Paragonimus westermani]|uniref:NTR domain-containing protein n=1 Tax=Paragonimus westermani TaxID=34504 RepID=A0A5J4NTA2_9TREM|nr:uncharacterized protein DEA37_0008995 [Paragonimus westermani]